jgi:hypothetical protein
MECLIITETLNNDSFIHHIDCEHITYDLILKYILSSKDDDKILKCGYGLIIKIKNKFYVVTVHHCIGYYPININCYIEHSSNIIKIPLRYVNSYPELDISLLEPVNDDLLRLISDLREISSNLSCIKNCVCNLNIFTDTNPHSLDFKKLILKMTVYDVYLSIIKSIIIPKIPIIVLKTDCKLFEGLSGSTLTNEHNEIIGMIYCYNNGSFEAIPIGIIMILINKLLNNIQLTTILCNSSICDININKESYTGHALNDIPLLSYTRNKKKTNVIFKKNDVILKINNRSFYKDGTLHCDEINFNISLEAYVLLNSESCVDVLYLKEKNGKYDNPKLINICAKSFNDIYDVKTNLENEYIRWNGLVFTILSEELILYLIKNNLNRSLTNYKRVENRNYVVLTDIDCNVHGKKFDVYKYYLVERIGKKSIYSLNKLYDVLKEYKKTKQIKINIKQSFSSPLEYITLNIFN